MSTQSIEGKRAESIENMIIICIAMLAAVLICYFYYEHPWYYFNLYFYKALNFIPDVGLMIMFPWQYDVAPKMVPAMAADLAHHAKDYSEYYLSDEVGIRKKRSIDNLAMMMVLPYVLAPILWIIVKELKKKKSIIKKPSEKNKSSGLYRYVQSQKILWPYVRPVANIMGDMMAETSLEKGWYASSQLPLSWMKERGLLKMLKPQKRRRLFTVQEKTEFTLDKTKAYVELKGNLGPLWRGVDQLSFTEKCLLAVIVPHIFGRIKMSRLLNRKLAIYYEQKKDKEALAKEAALLKDIEAEVESILELHKDAFKDVYFDEAKFEDPFDPLISSFEALSSEDDMFEKGHKMVQETLLTHAYTKTILFSLLQKAWTYGVLASSELLWVKTIDREIWYVMSQQGRTSAFAEVCGAWSHYLAEDAYGFKFLMPQLEEGLRSLDYDLYKTHDNVCTHEQWEDRSKWDKLVPDGIGKGKTIGTPPSGRNATKEV